MVKFAVTASCYGLLCALQIHTAGTRRIGGPMSMLLSTIRILLVLLYSYRGVRALIVFSFSSRLPGIYVYYFSGRRPITQREGAFFVLSPSVLCGACVNFCFWLREGFSAVPLLSLVDLPAVPFLRRHASRIHSQYIAFHTTQQNTRTEYLFP